MIKIIATIYFLRKMSKLSVQVEIKPINLENFEKIPLPCRSCIYWENPALFNEKLPEDDRIEIKKEWYRKTLNNYGICGKILFFRGQPVGYTKFAPPKYFRRLNDYDEKWLNEFSEKIVFITCLYIKNSYRRKGFGSLLLKEIINELREREVKEVYTYARLGNPNNPSGPLSFWLKNGFTIVDLKVSGFPLVKKII